MPDLNWREIGLLMPLLVAHRLARRLSRAGAPAHGAGGRAVRAARCETQRAMTDVARMTGGRGDDPFDLSIPSQLMLALGARPRC